MFFAVPEAMLGRDYVGTELVAGLLAVIQASRRFSSHHLRHGHCRVFPAVQSFWHGGLPTCFQTVLAAVFGRELTFACITPA
jgi:hypothetical protein